MKESSKVEKEMIPSKVLGLTPNPLFWHLYSLRQLTDTNKIIVYNSGWLMCLWAFVFSVKHLKHLKFVIGDLNFL